MDTKAAFEKAWKERYGYELRWETSLSGYRYKNENAAWWAWQASRAAIEIEHKPYCAWPDEEYSDSYINGWNDHADELTSHGIRIKGKTE